MKYKRLIYFNFLLFLLLLGLAGPALAQQVEITVAGDPPWKISADQVTSFTQDNIYEAEGNIRIVRGGEVITADYVRANSESQLVELRGEVILSSPDFKVVCQRLVLNFEHNIGKIYDGTVFFPQNHYYLSADEMERTGPDTFVVIDGTATSCDGPNPAWTLTGRHITVQREGFATATHARFTTRFFPLLYMPWVRIPIKTQRQSGFLLPTMGSSTRDGVTATLPFFWAISESADLTVYATYMGKRGLEPTVEFRFQNWGGQGFFGGSYLTDEDPPEITYPDNQGVKSPEERYWLRGMADFKTKNDIEIKANLDYASDSKYLDEFKNSSTGYNSTRDILLDEYGRELAEPLDPLRTSVVQATKSSDNQLLRLGLFYTDNLNERKNVDTVQRLPQAGLDLTRQRIPQTPLYFDMMTDYNYFTRKTDSLSQHREQGHRLDLHPRLYLPVSIGRYLDFESTVGVRETLYFPHGFEDNPIDPEAEEKNERMLSRSLFDAELKLSTDISRVYNVKLGRMEKVKHKIKPEVTFNLIPSRNQDDLPYWDRDDRIQEERKIRYGISNYLIGKVKADEGEFKAAESGDYGLAAYNQAVCPRYDYTEFFRLGVFRSYDFIEEYRDLDDRQNVTGWPSTDRRPNSPVEFELEASLNPWFWVQSANEYDSYSKTFSKHSVEMQAKDPRGDFLYVGYELNTEPYSWIDRFGREQKASEYEEIHYLLNLALNKKVSFQFDKRHSILHNENIETTYALTFKPQCWGLRLEYMDRPEDQSVAVFFNLLGLGEVGSYSYRTEKQESSSRN